MREPENMEEVLYFTNRTLENDGHLTAWVYKIDCPACGKAKMGKPVVKGKVKIRAKEYVCPECGHTEEKQEHEEALTLEIKYTCPYCHKEGFAETIYKRKTFQGVPSYIFSCEGCGKKIGVTQKMKEPKKK